RAGGSLSRLGGVMTGRGAAGLLATALFAAAPVSAATIPAGTLYFTCFGNQGSSSGPCALPGPSSGTSSENVQSVTYSYGSTGLKLTGPVTAVADTQGADGIQFINNGQDMVVAGQASHLVTELAPNNSGGFGSPTTANVSSLGQVDHISVAPSGQYILAGGYSGGGLALIPINSSGTIQAGINCPLSSLNGGVVPSVMDTVVWVGQQAYYTASLPTGPGQDFGGYGVFGAIDVSYAAGPPATCSAKLTQLLPAVASGGAASATSGFEAAHGMAYDPFSNSIIMFGSTMVAQVQVSGTATATVASEVVFGTTTAINKCTIAAADCLLVPSDTFGGQPFDQGAVDGLGHVFVSNNNGNLVSIDYSGASPKLISKANPNHIYDQPLTGYLDDVAPLLGTGGQMAVSTSALPTPASTSTPSIAPLGGSIGDTATVSNYTTLLGNDPGATGSVVFSLYQGTSCTTNLIPSLPSVPLDASGFASTGASAYTPTAPGVYRWQATVTIKVAGNTYASIPPFSSPCNGNRSEPVSVIIPTAISTQASPGGSPGTSVTDTATVTSHVQFLTSDETTIAAMSISPIPTGTVSFSLHGPSTIPSCSGTPVFSSATGVLLDAGRATSPAVTLTTPGTYYWVASYTPSGSIFGSAVGSCGADNETVTISSTPTPPPPAANTPTVTTVPSAGGPVGTALSDTAHVTGIVSPGTSDSVSFALYSDPSCTTLADNLGNASLTGPATSNGVPTWAASSPGSGYAPSVAGTYYWGVSFNSVNDPANLSSSPLCGEPVTITTSGGTLGAHTTPTPPPAGAVKAASTPTPNTGADLFLPGLLAALALFFGGLLLLTGGKLRRNPSL
ncbi:MAG: hypothetical protein ACYDD0_10485, partial [Candidatus Dormibacteria bacterium]